MPSRHTPGSHERLENPLNIVLPLAYIATVLPKHHSEEFRINLLSNDEDNWKKMPPILGNGILHLWHGNRVHNRNLNTPVRFLGNVRHR